MIRANFLFVVGDQGNDWPRLIRDRNENILSVDARTNFARPHSNRPGTQQGTSRQEQQAGTGTQAMNVDHEDELRIQAPPGAASASESRLQLDGTGLMPEAQCEVQGEKDLRSRFQPALTQCQLTGSASDGPRKLEPPNETSAIIPLQPARRARRGHHGDLMLRELANRSRGSSAGTETVGREQADVL